MSAVPTQNEAQADDHVRVAELLSAFMDNEADLPAELLRSDTVRAQWATYHFIGDVLRSEELAISVSPTFNQRLAAALETEPPIVAPRRRTAMRFIGRYAVPGVALVAAVVAVTWMAQPLIAPTTRSLQASAQASEGRLTSASLSNTPLLADYLDVHRHSAGFTAVGAGSELDMGQQ